MFPIRIGRAAEAAVQPFRANVGGEHEPGDLSGADAFRLAPQVGKRIRRNAPVSVRGVDEQFLQSHSWAQVERECLDEPDGIAGKPPALALCDEDPALCTRPEGAGTQVAAVTRNRGR